MCEKGKQTDNYLYSSNFLNEFTLNTSNISQETEQDRSH